MREGRKWHPVPGHGVGAVERGRATGEAPAAPYGARHAPAQIERTARPRFVVRRRMANAINMNDWNAILRHAMPGRAQRKNSEDREMHLQTVNFQTEMGR